MKKILLILSLLLAVTACNSGGTTTRPDSPEEKRRNESGRITGEGVTLVGRSEGDKAAEKNPLGVNSFLWRATLDTLSFMPLASADPFGGVIITDWYEDPNTPGERFKVNALILDKTLRADGVKVTVFKQTADKSKGGWKDQKVDETLGRQLEDTILTRARQLKVAQMGH